MIQRTPRATRTDTLFPYTTLFRAFDAVLHDSYAQDHIHLAPLDFPRPMFGLAIDAGSKGQEQKLATALHKLAEEDPCFQVEHLPDTNETVISGLSDLHLRVNLDRLKERHGVDEIGRAHV